MTEIQGRFKKRMVEGGGALWVPDTGIIAPEGKQLFNVAGGAPLFDQLVRGVDLTHSEIASAQSCLRLNTWGSIGKADKYHIYFQMLGHFSFYRLNVNDAKQWSILTAIDFLVKDLGLDKKDLLISCHPDDLLTQKLWKDFGFGAQIELIYDKHDALFLENRSGYRTKIGLKGASGEVIRFWDIVFLEFGDETFTFPLDKIIVDSGMAVDRLHFAISGQDSSYKTSYWTDYVKSVGNVLQGSKEEDIKRIADIGQAISVCALSGLKPEANKQSYILRKLIREFYVLVRVLGHEAVLEKVLNLCLQRGTSVYPQDLQKVNTLDVKKICLDEIAKFQISLQKGLKKAEELKSKSGGILSSADKKYLTDTFGLPTRLL